MKPSVLKEWMKKNKKTALDVACALRMNPVTVSRYLAGKKVHLSTEAAFERLVNDPTMRAS